MKTIPIEEAQATLVELIHCLSPGDEVVITEDNQPVARLAVPSMHPNGGSPICLGTMRGSVQHMAPDFDAPLDDFKDYME